ncbi:hypothetical protein V8E36_006998 [Tilletia maclaganii]
MSKKKGQTTIRRCAQKCLDPLDPRMRMPLPCHCKRQGAKGKAADTQSGETETAKAMEEAQLVHGQTADSEVDQALADVAAAAAAVATAAAASSLQPGEPEVGAESCDQQSLSSGTAAPLTTVIAASGGSEAGNAIQPPPIFQSRSGAMVVDTGSAHEGMDTFSDEDEEIDGTIAASSAPPIPEPPGQSDKIVEAAPDPRAQGEPVKNKKKVNTRAEPSLTDLDQRAIWMDLGQAHKYAKEHYSFEQKSEERIRQETRAWRLIEQAARLSRRTGMGVIVGLTHLDNGKHLEPHDYFYASPNLCDASRPSLRKMAQSFSDEFKQVMHTYREAGRLEAAEHIAANKALIADKTRLQQQNEELLAKIKALEAQCGSGTTSVT